MIKKRSFRRRFNIFFLLNDNFKTILIIISIHNAIKWHNLDNNATLKKLKHVYSRRTFDSNQRDL